MQHATIFTSDCYLRTLTVKIFLDLIYFSFCRLYVCTEKSLCCNRIYISFFIISLDFIISHYHYDSRSLIFKNYVRKKYLALNIQTFVYSFFVHSLTWLLFTWVPNHERKHEASNSRNSRSFQGYSSLHFYLKCYSLHLQYIIHVRLL